MNVIKFRGAKIFVCQFSNIGGSIFTNILKNEIGAITFNYIAPGDFELISTNNQFSYNKTFITYNLNEYNAGINSINFQFNGFNRFKFLSLDSSGTPTDNAAGFIQICNLE
jgi:S-adenosylmethionine hydrolase